MVLFYAVELEWVAIPDTRNKVFPSPNNIVMRQRGAAG
jgi:hypothetical protein